MLPFLVPMDVAETGAVQIRAEERFRTGSDVTAEESELNPQIRYDAIWTGGNDHFVALYQPRFVLTHTFKRNLPDPTQVNPETINTADPNATPTSALHNGGLGLEMVRPRWRLSAYQFAAYGPITTTSLLVQPVWGGDAPPPDPNPIIPTTIAARFTLLFAQTQIFVPIRLSRRVALIPGFVFNAFGGANSDSRAAMAMTYGPGANLVLDVAASRFDRLTSTIGAGKVDTLFEGDRTGATIYRAEANEQWRHWWTGSLSTGLLAGGTIGGDAINGSTIYSLAQADVLYDGWGIQKLEPGAPPMGANAGRGNHLQLGAVVKAQPWLDLFSGDLEQRGVVTVAANDTMGLVTLRAAGSTARVFNTPRSVARYSIFQVEAGIKYQALRQLSIDGGVRYGQQNIDNAIRFNDLNQTTVFAGLLYTPLPARF